MNKLVSLAGVHTHTHTHTSLILKEEKRVDNIYSKGIVLNRLLLSKQIRMFV